MNKRKIFFLKTYLIISIICFIFKNINAQDQNYNVVKVAPYEPTLSDAYKINQNPKIVDTVYPKPNVIYQFRTKQFQDISFNVEPIKPAKMQPEPLSKLYKHYLKIGFGNYITPYAEYDFNSSRSKNILYGVHADHLSSSGNIKNFAFSGYSDNDLDLYGKKFTVNHTWYGNIDLNRNVVHYYGFNPSDTFNPSKNIIKQQFINIGATIGVKSNYLDSLHLNHSFQLAFYNFTDHYKTSENNIKFDGSFSKNLHFMNLTKMQTIGLDINGDIYNNNDTTLTTGNGVIDILPSVETKYSSLDIKIGVNASIQADVKSEVKFYPVLDLGLDIAHNVVYAYAGMTGGLNKINFKELSIENPFVSSILPLNFMNTKGEYFLGLKGNFSSEISFNLKGSYSIIDNMPFFVDTTYTVGMHKFTLVYDDVDILKAKGELSYKMDEKIILMLGADLYNYTMKNELKAWYKPDFDASLSINYNIQNKIIVKGDVFYYGNMFAKTYDSDNNVVAKQINGYVDANIGVEYRYSKILSGFINFNNLAAARYNRWLNYPTYKFNFIAGITYALK